MMDGTGSHIDAMENMDESDPVNDLEDFRTFESRNCYCQLLVHSLHTSA
jgi:hypothetical protein